MRAANRRHGLVAGFGARGVRLRTRHGSLTLSLRAIGHGKALHAVGSAVPDARENRVAYRRRGLTEWYANGPLGLEQGFAVGRRPAGARGGPLTLALGWSGRLVPRLDRDRRGLTLRGRDGRSRLAYRGLWASDADGRDLRAWLELRGGRVLVRVADAGARYPLQIDPFFQRAKLTASDGSTGDLLGTSIAISGNTLVAGAPWDDIGANGNQGSAYVFAKPPSGWANATQTAKLTASDGAASHALGMSVAIDGDTIVAGAPGANAAYVFVKPSGGWVNSTQTAKLTVPGIVSYADLGDSVDVSGGVVVAGAPYDNAGGAINEGAAYVFEKPGGGWANKTQSATLVNYYGAPQDLLGASVAISGDSVVAGAWSADADPGFVDVFNKPGATWGVVNGGIEYHEARLSAPDSEAYDYFGWSVAMDGGVVVVGAPHHTIGGRLSQGAAYVYQRVDAVTWPNRAKLTASDGTNNDLFGWSVGIAGSRIIAGAIGDDAFRGAAYVFANPGTGWQNAAQTARVVASDGVAGDNFATSAAISGATLGIGVDLDGVGANAHQGSAHVFSLAPSAPAVGGPATVVAGAPATFTASIGDGGDGGVAPDAVRWIASGGLPEQHGTTVSYQFPAPGTYTLRVSATDSAGNVSPETAITVAVDPAPLVDADGDGVLGAADCDDANAAIHPGAHDVPANGIDEDCDHVDAQVRLDPPIRNRWAYSKKFAIVLALTVRDVPAGAVVEVRCSGPRPKRRTRKNRKVGCPFVSRKWPKTKKKTNVNLLKPFAKRKLLVKTVLEIRITAPGTIGKLVRYRVVPNMVPRAKGLCLKPGAPAPTRC